MSNHGPNVERVLPPDHAARDRICTDLDTNLLVEAAAGTGKTTSLMNRMVGLIAEDKCNIESMVAVTFTRKAAAELRTRFQTALEKAAREATGPTQKQLVYARDHIERCFIGTIHSFCARLLRERPMEAGVDLAFQEIDEHDDVQLRQQAWRQYVATLFAEDDAILKELDDLGITGLITKREQILAELNELGLDVDQLAQMFQQFAEFPDVSDWPAEKIELPELDSVIDDVRQYVAHMEDMAPDFPDNRGNDELMDLYELVPRLFRRVNLARTADVMNLLGYLGKSTKIVQRNWTGGKDIGKREKTRWEEFVAEKIQPLITLWLQKRYESIIRALKPALKIYEHLRQQAGGLNFQDLLLKSAGLLCDKPAIRRYFRQRFTHILVDEFQDTDPIQAEVLLLLTARDPHETNWQRCRPEPGALFVVGDPRQSIYRFRRADIVTYDSVKKVIIESGGDVVPLTTNFRSTGKLIAWTNSVFEASFPAVENRFSPAHRAMLVGRQEASPGELEGIRVIQIPSAYFRNETSVEYEATLIARTIRQALDDKLTVPRSEDEIANGMTPQVTSGDFLIVTHRKASLSVYAQKLQELDVPHQVTGGRFLASVPQVQLLAKCLEAVVEPDNPVALVALLRGGGFGFSDQELYAFREAGGRFDYRSQFSELFPGEVNELFDSAFGRLRQYAAWLRQLPPIPAFERIAADLGLPMQALTAVGGNVQSGSFSKVMELLREAQSDVHSVSNLVDWLKQLLDKDAEFDGLPARANTTDVVRIMNLHKVKGLEAPIVFLAAPVGHFKHLTTMHIDRADERPRGYAAIYGKKKGYHRAPLLAQPKDWEDRVAEEDRFLEAETTRLMYVAATRARAQLVIVQRDEKRNRQNPWQFFAPHVSDCGHLPDPGAQPCPKRDYEEIDHSHLAEVESRVLDGWNRVKTPTYATAAAKEISISGSRPVIRDVEGEHGTQWGELIHLLLQTVRLQPTADLNELAYAALTEQSMDLALIQPAVSTVRTVVGSEIWQRANRSDHCLVEVPFQMLQPKVEHKLPTILRGVIDLVFRESNGWVIVDYKTDATRKADLPGLIEHYRGQVHTYSQAWQLLTKEKVVETGLYFTNLHHYAELFKIGN